jgi:dUTP pyrophosphatase
VLAPGDRFLVPTGFRFAIPPGYEGQVRPRSGLALEHGILVPNAPGTIDSDYRGELRVILLNAGEKSHSIRRGDRIAQLVIAPVTTAAFCECDELEATDRGEGGFGHSDRDTRGGES